ncbi:MAG: tRNA (adenosine(37)-N6)-threonylcarbamoyltransferase complex ATPase subunit type 1 TsaE [Rhizobiaceae bacterium]|nr:tRNA (adenosine(37)-N6)-threonylcarbamoyltransferase complex ATPase subunit type 1 TsaE [Rhizobiaceae bacterium]
MTVRHFRRFLPDESATAILGNDLAAAVRPGDVLALHGDLGAGKTMLARAIIRALAANPDLEVPSPTFTVVQSYDARFPVAHFDLYRVTSVEELEELGFDEATTNGVVLVEWPERAGELLPAHSIEVVLGEEGAGRSARISASGPAADRIGRSFDIRGFLIAAGEGNASRTHLIGDASTRAYETLALADGAARILMDAPRRPDGPPIRDGRTYSQVAKLAESVVPFVAVASALKKAGFCAPVVHASDLDNGLLVLEQLGDEGVIAADGTPIPERYLAAAGLLADLHADTWPHVLPVAEGVEHRLPDYDREAMLIELSLMLDWYLPHEANRQITNDERHQFFDAWNAVLDRLERAEKTIVLRDFHSPNLIWRANHAGNDCLGLIDFQDAVYGPAAYDVASLAMDARVTVPPDLQDAVVSTYAQARARQGPFDRAAFDEAFAIMAAQRNAKVLGIFVRLNKRDGKPGYMRHLPRCRAYFAQALRHPSLAPVEQALQEIGLAEALEA